MKTLLEYEFKKFFNKKKNLIIITIFIIFLFVYALINIRIDNNLINQELINCNFEIDSYQNALNSLKVDYDRISKTEDKKSINKLNNLIDSSEKNLELYYKRRDAIIEKDWKKQLEYENKIDRKLLEDLNQKNIVSDEDSSVIKNRISLNELLLSKNIKPINLYCSMTGFNFLRLICDDLVPMILVIIIFLFAADFVSSEVDEGTYKLLLTQPISRNKILLSKIIASTIICITTISFILFIFFIGIGITRGFGSPNYPIPFNKECFSATINSDKYCELTWLGLLSFIFYMIPFYIVFIVAMVSIAILISTCIGSNSGAISSSVIIYVIFFILGSQLKVLGKLAGFLPFTYSNIPMLLNGEAIKIYGNKNITYINGIIVLVSTTLLCYIISFIIFRKKDIV